MPLSNLKSSISRPLGGKWIVITLLSCMSFSLVCGCASLKKGVDNIGDKFAGKKSTASSIISEEDSLDPMGARSHRRLLWDDLAPSQLTTTLKSKLGSNKGEDSAQRSFATGKRIFDQASQMIANNPDGTQHVDLFIEAAGHFRTASSSLPDSSLAEDAMFLEGESFFFSDRYVQSNRAFEGLIADYSGSRYLDRAEQRRYSIALFWLDLKKNGASIALNDPKRPKFSLAGEARRILHRIRIDDPTGKLADDATFALATAYMDAGRFEEAADTYSYLRKDYPGSEYQFKAQMLELESLLKSYKGADYDGTPLAKAEKLRKQIATQFPDQSSQYQDILAQQGSLITNQLVQRDVEVGQFYERRGENRAAKIYYEKAKTDFGGSVFTNELDQRIETVASLPPVPKPPAQWIQKVFPDADSEKSIIPTGGGLDTIIR
jgi:outer membrane protein assembly factor BamD (BamD/ComL family)